MTLLETWIETIYNNANSTVPLLLYITSVSSKRAPLGLQANGADSSVDSPIPVGKAKISSSPSRKLPLEAHRQSCRRGSASVALRAPLVLPVHQTSAAAAARGLSKGDGKFGVSSYRSKAQKRASSPCDAVQILGAGLLAPQQGLPAEDERIL